MQTEKYKNWLKAKNLQDSTITTKLSKVERVEKYYGSLDDLHKKDRLEGLISELTYTTQDRNNNRPNETRIPFNGDAYKILSTHKNAVNLYKKSLEDDADSSELELAEEEPNTEESPQKIGLEKDMQAAIRRNISQVESGLTITDGGKERSVETGYIDITAKDDTQTPVVIELKTGVAGQRAVAQIISYMGSLVDEEERDDVRGILIASEFDKKAQAAARVIPALTLMRYQFSFQFFAE